GPRTLFERLPLATLVAQPVEHVLDVLVPDLRRRPARGEAREMLELDLRLDLDLDLEGELRAPVVLHIVHPPLRYRHDALRLERLAVRLLDEIVDRLLVDRGPEALLDDARRQLTLA